MILHNRKFLISKCSQTAERTIIGTAKLLRRPHTFFSLLLAAFSAMFASELYPALVPLVIPKPYEKHIYRRGVANDCG